MLLAGDIGGTKTNLAIISPEAGVKKPLMEKTFSSGDYDSLEDLVLEFLKESPYAVEYACFGVAGPVVNGKSRITNLPWIISEELLKEKTGIKEAQLINDLVSISKSISALEEEDLFLLKPGKAEQHGNIAVVAPGTGLGEGFVTWSGTKYIAYPSEGGHTDFGPKNKLEADMLVYLQQKYGHVSYERVCSGVGIPNIYEFLKESGFAEEPEWFAAEAAKVEDKTPLIFTSALTETRECPLCHKTLEMFIHILGAECGNAALKFLSTGGLFLGGGIPPRILNELKSEFFLDAFLEKGRFAKLLADIPIQVILNAKSALIGAAFKGLEDYFYQS